MEPAQAGLLCWVGLGWAGERAGEVGRGGEGLGWAGKSPGEKKASVELRCVSVQGRGSQHCQCRARCHGEGSKASKVQKKGSWSVPCFQDTLGKLPQEICPRPVPPGSHFHLWPYTPALRKDLCCMVTPILLWGSVIPKSTAIIDLKGTIFLLDSHYTPNPTTLATVGLSAKPVLRQLQLDQMLMALS